MCGIFGYNKKDPALAKQFLHDLAHRGPDAEATVQIDAWTLGHLRLSIIDTTTGANQPFVRDGNYLVFNGEIYNYLELKARYLADETFTTTSDTEVLCALLNRYGIGILNQLNGMFAFAWYEGTTKTLWLGRDRFGVKPLYYMNSNQVLYFASEIRPLALMQHNVELDPGILASFFADTATDFDARSGISGISQVQPGHIVAVTEGGDCTQQAWYAGHDYQCDTSIFKNKEATITAFENLLTDAISLRHRADVPICITLSGGLDSTTLYVLAKEKLNSSIQPFIFAHTGARTDESDRALALARAYGDEPHIVTSDPTHAADTLAEALYHLEFPIWNPSAVAYLDMYTAIKQHGYTVVIEGHGSDEQLGGYPYMLDAAWKTAFFQGNLRFAVTLYRAFLATANPALGQMSQSPHASTFSLLLPMMRGLLRGVVKTIVWPKKIKYLQFETLVRESFEYKILPIVLRTFDRLSMARSLESRCPFMDYRVVEFLRALPLEYKVNEIGSKAILREILKKYGHESIYAHKAKMGFASDVPALLNDPQSRKTFTQAIQSFDHPTFATQKNAALTILQKETLGWGDVDALWKVTAVRMTENMYALKQ